MRVLVTGGAGFIGSNFILKSLEMYPDNTYICFDSLTYAGDLGNFGKLLENDDRLRITQASILDLKSLEIAISESDLVVHFAAETHNDRSLNSPNIFIDTNVVGTLNVINSCLKFGVRLHHVSTDEVFGDLPIESPEKFTESTNYNPSSPYSASKAASDHLVRAWHRSFGLKATISNCSNNFGPRQNKEKLIPRTIYLAMSNIRPKIYGSGLNVRDWIYVDDHTTGIWAVIQRGKLGETYLLGADNQRSNLSIVQDILEKLGKPKDFVEYVEDRPGHDLKYAIDASKAKEHLGWSANAKSFSEQMDATIEFYLSNSVDIEDVSHSGLSDGKQ